MKKTLSKNLFREIRSTLSRFIAIFAITALGAGFYAGLKSTGHDMALTADQYYHQQYLADYRLLSTMGFTEADVELLRQNGQYSAVMPTYGADVLLEGPDGPQAVRLQGHPFDAGQNAARLNQPVLLEGRMPQNETECLADAQSGRQLGDEIHVLEENEKETLELLRERTFTVVGVCNSPSYIAFGRGRTTIGSGNISTYYIVPESAFDSEYYTEVFLQDAEATELSAFSAEYGTITKNGVEQLETFAKEREEARYREITEEAEEELASARAELADGQQEYEDQRTEAETELAEAHDTLLEGEAEAQNGRQEIAENEDRLATGQNQLAEGESTLAAAAASLEENRGRLSQGQAEYDQMHLTLQTGQETYDQELARYETERQNYEANLALYRQQEAEYLAARAALDEQWQAYNTATGNLETIRAAASSLQASQEQLAALAPPAQTNPEAAAQCAAISAESAAVLRQTATALSESAPTLSAALATTAEGVDAAAAAQDYAQAAQLLAGVSAPLAQFIAETQTLLDNAKTQLDSSEAELAPHNDTLSAAWQELEAGRTLLDTAAAELETNRLALEGGWAGLAEAAATLEAGALALAAGEAQMQAGTAELSAARQTLEEGQAQIANARRTLAEAETELANGWADYEDARQEAEEEFLKAEEELAEAEEELADAERQLAELEPPEWYVLDRESNPGYTGFDSDTIRIDSIAKVFPVFFFLVATLICLTTMTRMVEEQRTQIGTLKALGYAKSTIAFKYLFYGFMASFLGSVCGVLVGSQVFPKSIWSAYQMLYIMPSILTPLHPLHAGVSITACVLCTLLATLAACYNELRSVPSELMRPKAPSPGKRVLLEYIRPLWRRMSFNQKVTARNILRYKKRFLMTVIGVAGCTALLLTGFGLRDSINGLVAAQFGEIFCYDAGVSLSHTQTPQEDSELNETAATLGQSLYVQQSNLEVYFKGKTNTDMTTSLHISEDPGRLHEFITLQNRATGQAIPFPAGNGVLVSEKLASRLSAETGDIIEIALVGQTRIPVEIAGIVENYVFNYVYMAPGTYTALYGEAPEYNTVLVRFDETARANPADAFSRLVAAEGVAGVMDVADFRIEFGDMLKSLDAVILVILISAGALAFVVLYNLTNINITERTREIATLKVLGFFPREVASYIFRENLFLTTLGALVGLPLGLVLHRFVITAIEVDEVMFRRVIEPQSYLFAILFTLLSALVVDFVMLRNLRRIDMVESLKSAE